MLIFDREEFVSGTIVVKEPVEKNGKTYIKKYRFKPEDKGQEFEFENEEYILEHYPVLFQKV